MIEFVFFTRQHCNDSPVMHFDRYRSSPRLV
jgi:hypothetical protein